MVIAIKIIQLLLSLSILVILHELGHFIAARSFKTRVEKFYLFFDPWFSLFKFKKGDTEYGIGWLPLGGYVKIAGMIDESLDTEQMKQPPQPWELRSKPAWQRLIVMLGGILVNLFLAVAIFAVMLAAWGERYLPADEAKYGVSVDSLGRTMGLQNGDIVLTVDRKPVDGFNDITEAILVDNAASVQVLRDGQQVDVLIPKGFVRKLIKANRADFLSPRFPFVIDEVMSSSAAQAAGMQKNDRIIGVNDSVRLFFSEIRADFRKYANQTVNIKVLRGA
ncbi:MAG TPA: site-2 protease family protein, partial [Bacteroidales bacterium]|nr:site-2 protease family protein [Bacteroidales bacterium]